MAARNKGQVRWRVPMPLTGGAGSAGLPQAYGARVPSTWQLAADRHEQPRQRASP